MNTKGYKQIFLVLVVGLIIIPQITFAAWWNPFTWKIFNKTPQTSEIEKLRSEVEELKKKTATPTPSPVKPSTVVGEKSKTTTKLATPATKPVVSATELKKQDPQQYKALVTENKTQLLEASKLLSNKNIIARVKPSVVYIETTTGSGSGVIVGVDGYILTNAHVVSDTNSVTVKLSNGGSYKGTVIGRDENIDIALLKISASGLSTAFLGDSDSVEQGDPVFTFGYPLGIEGDVAFKDGTLSRRQKIDGTTYLEISAQILPGNSGGPLVNQLGEVIGINTLAIGTLKVSGVLIGETLKFALPINVAKNLIPELKSGRNIVLPKITRPSLPTPSPSPTPTPQPLPTPEPTPAPSCTKDTWSCSDWSACSNSGSQARACNITFDCSVANTPSPNTTQSCTPPFPSIPISLQDISSVERMFSITNLTSEKITIEKLRLRLNSLIGSGGTSILPSADAFIYISVNFPKSYDKSSYYPIADKISINNVESGIFDFIWREQVGKNCYGYVDDIAIPKECLRTGTNRFFRNELQPNETINIRIAFDSRVLAGYSTLEVVCPQSYQFYLDYIDGGIIRKSTGENILFSSLPMKEARINDSCQVIQ